MPEQSRPDINKMAKNLKPNLDNLTRNLSEALSRGYVRREAVEVPGEGGRTVRVQRLVADNDEGQAFIDRYRAQLSAANARSSATGQQEIDSTRTPARVLNQTKVDSLIEAEERRIEKNQGNPDDGYEYGGIAKRQERGDNKGKVNDSNQGGNMGEGLTPDSSQMGVEARINPSYLNTSGSEGKDPTRQYLDEMHSGDLAGADFKNVSNTTKAEISEMASGSGMTEAEVREGIKKRSRQNDSFVRGGARYEDRTVNGGEETLPGFSVTGKQMERARQEMESDLAAREIEKRSEGEPQSEANETGSKAEMAKLEQMIAEQNETIKALQETVLRLTEVVEGRAPSNQAEAQELTRQVGEIATQNSEQEAKAQETSNSNLEELQELNRQREEIRGEDKGEPEESKEEMEADAEKTVEEAKDQYLQLLSERRRWFGKRRVSEEDLAEARANYERAATNAFLTRAEKIVAEKFPQLEGEQREAMVGKQASAEMVFEFLSRCETESAIENGTKFKKAVNWLKQNPKTRFVLGLTLAGVGFVGMTTGNIPLTVAAVSGRAALSGVGTAMATESGLDWVQKRTDARLHGVTTDQISQMSSDEANQIMAAQRAYLVRRGDGVEGSAYSENIKAVLSGAEADTIQRMGELMEQTGDADMARGRAITEALNNINIASERADQSERSKSITRAVGAGVAGLLAGGLTLYAGLSRIPKPRPEGHTPPRVVPKPTPETPNPTPAPEAPEPRNPLEGFNHTERIGRGEHIWGVTEGNLQKAASRLGMRLSPNQMEAAIDRGKDWYIANGYGHGPKHWLMPGDRLPVNGRNLEQWLRYGLEHPKR